MSEILTKSALRTVVLVLLIVAWQALSNRSEGLKVPTPWETLSAMWSMTIDGSLPRGLAESNIAMILGYGLALVTGVVLGLIIGQSRIMRKLVDPYLTILIALPMIAVLPVIQIIFGLTLVARVSVVFLFAFPYIVISTRAGLDTIDTSLIEMSQSFRARWWERWRWVILPGAMPGIMAGARLGISRAVLGMVIAELLLVSPGVGSMLLAYQDSFQTDYVFGILAALILEGVVVMMVADKVEERALSWRKA